MFNRSGVQPKRLLSLGDRNEHKDLIEEAHITPNPQSRCFYRLGVSEIDSERRRVVNERFIVVDKQIEFTHTRRFSAIFCYFCLDAFA